MAELAVTRCAAPVIRKTSTYTVLGLVGYSVASLLAAALFLAWELPLADRVIATFVPPLALLIVVSVTRSIVGGRSGLRARPQIWYQSPVHARRR